MTSPLNPWQAEKGGETNTKSVVFGSTGQGTVSVEMVGGGLHIRKMDLVESVLTLTLSLSK